MPINYSNWNFTDITLTPEEERRSRNRLKKLVNDGGTGELMERHRAQAPSKFERSLSKAYHEAETPEERIVVLDYWLQHLYRLYADMTKFEQKSFGYRVRALCRLAHSLINRDMRAIRLRHSEQRVVAATGQAPKINIKTITSDIVRIHEAMSDAGIYAEQTEVGRIVALYHVETSLKDVEGSYRATRDKNEDHSAPSKKLLKFLEILADQLTDKAREQLAEHCIKSKKKNVT